MKKAISLAALALTMSAAFAQAPAAAADNAEPQANPSAMVRQIGMAMGVLPATQKACGHSEPERARLKKGLVGFDAKLSSQLPKDLMSEYRSGFSQSDKLTVNEFANVSKERKVEICEQFESHYKDIMSKLEQATVVPK